MRPTYIARDQNGRVVIESPTRRFVKRALRALPIEVTRASVTYRGIETKLSRAEDGRWFVAGTVQTLHAGSSYDAVRRLAALSDGRFQTIGEPVGEAATATTVIEPRPIGGVLINLGKIEPDANVERALLEQLSRKRIGF